jgi:uncharacterized protein YutE (UPF0331/DUF86 family)
LASELQEKLNEALTKLPQVKVPEAEVNNIAENAAENLSVTLGEFVSAWRVLESHILEKLNEHGKSTHRIFESGKLLKELGVFDEQQEHTFRKMQRIRNQIVHPAEVKVSEAEIRNTTKSMLVLIDAIGNFQKK